ncbi:MAG TPA: NAD(P)-dependent oxidoreductase [Candidatus Sulfomarinibacteraceae bacterium]|nr:NAD(P)-dependent oxidoreductase [Candidatus Sulfomarinibacteraceae bacterium]
MSTYNLVFTTERSQRHQETSIAAAPDFLNIAMLQRPDKETLKAHLQDAEYLISERVGVVDEEVIQAAPDLKMILRLGSLTHDIDVEAARKAGVIVTYWPVVPVIRVAEHVVLQMLTLSKKLRETEAIALEASSEWGESKRTDEDTFAYNWSAREDVDGLWQKTVGIIGFGEIGTELARRLHNWGVTLLYNKRRRLPPRVEDELNLTYVEMDDLFVQSDYVANLLPYFPQTDQLLDKTFFDKMKPGACLVSSGSGSVINEQDLAEAIRSGKLGGAALDTFEWEPLRPENPLIPLAKKGYNVLLTPHIAAGSLSAAARERAKYYTNIVNHIEDKPIHNRIA